MSLGARDVLQDCHGSRVFLELGNLLCWFPFIAIPGYAMSMDEREEYQVQQGRMVSTLEAYY